MCDPSEISNQRPAINASPGIQHRSHFYGLHLKLQQRPPSLESKSVFFAGDSRE